MNRIIDIIAADFKSIWKRSNFIESFLLGSWLLILALIPFHALLSTWGGSSIGPLEVWKSWKEILLLLCLLLGAGYLTWRKQWPQLIRDPLLWLIAAYTLLHLVIWGVKDQAMQPSLAGILMNLRFMGIFLLSGVLLTFVPRSRLLRLALVVLFAGGVGVLVFGLAQLCFLPKDFLRHFGYGPQTIAPYITLDANEAIVRVQSTLRGPNPFGQYLILLGLLFAAMWRKERKLAQGGLVLCGLLLFATHSRSAWIGAAVAAVAWLALTVRDTYRRRRWAWAGAVGGALLIGLVWWLIPQSPALQHLVLHNKTGDTDIGSTALHFQAGTESLQRIARHPEGSGPGSAGPASFYGSWPQVPENYYLQIAEEVGLLGLLLFAAINAVVVWRLWQARKHTWAAVWLAAYAGLAVVNLFLHGWADDTTALIWWAMAGVLVLPEVSLGGDV